MKKIIALALALMMTLGCTVALATEPVADVNMTNRVSTLNVQPNFLVTKETTTEGLSGAMEAAQRTDVWLQVEASGQIDVTVPLVAVFKTNIDGGRDTIANTYKIINHSSAALAVTKVVIEDQNADVSANGNGDQLSMVKEAELTGYNKYSLHFKPTDFYKTDAGKANPVWQVSQDVADSTSAQDGGLMKTNFEKTTEGGKTIYTKDSHAVAGDEKQGLWLIDREIAGSTDNQSYIELVLNTTKLSFVTSKNKKEAAVEDGVKIFTITYTVKIDDSSKVGEDIFGRTNGSVYEGEEHSKPGEYEYIYQGLTTNLGSKVK